MQTGHVVSACPQSSVTFIIACVKIGKLSSFGHLNLTVTLRQCIGFLYTSYSAISVFMEPFISYLVGLLRFHSSSGMRRVYHPLLSVCFIIISCVICRGKLYSRNQRFDSNSIQYFKIRFATYLLDQSNYDYVFIDVFIDV